MGGVEELDETMLISSDDEDLQVVSIEGPSAAAPPPRPRVLAQQQQEQHHQQLREQRQQTTSLKIEKADDVSPKFKFAMHAFGD